MAKYKNKEDLLFCKLASKYNVDPSVFGLAPESATGFGQPTDTNLASGATGFLQEQVSGSTATAPFTSSGTVQQPSLRFGQPSLGSGQGFGSPAATTGVQSLSFGSSRTVPQPTFESGHGFGSPTASTGIQSFGYGAPTTSSNSTTGSTTLKFGASSSDPPMFSFGSSKSATGRTQRRVVRASFASFTAKTPQSKESPVFIPVSAENAFVYRTVSHLSLEDFKNLDADIIDRLGREEAGRMRWKAMSSEEKYKVVHDAVTDPLAYKQRLQTTDFDSFLKVLKHFIGGIEVQTNILEEQTRLAANKLHGSTRGLAKQLLSIHERCKVLGKPTGHLKEHFWSLYKNQSFKRCHPFGATFVLTVYIAVWRNLPNTPAVTCMIEQSLNL